MHAWLCMPRPIRLGRGRLWPTLVVMGFNKPTSMPRRDRRPDSASRSRRLDEIRATPVAAARDRVAARELEGSPLSLAALLGNVEDADGRTIGRPPDVVVRWTAGAPRPQMTPIVVRTGKSNVMIRARWPAPRHRSCSRSASLAPRCWPRPSSRSRAPTRSPRRPGSSGLSVGSSARHRCFYGLFTAQLVIGAVIALLPGNLVALVINAQVLNGFITPVLLTYILIWRIGARSSAPQPTGRSSKRWQRSASPWSAFCRHLSSFRRSPDGFDPRADPPDHEPKEIARVTRE